MGNIKDSDMRSYASNSIKNAIRWIEKERQKNAIYAMAETEETDEEEFLTALHDNERQLRRAIDLLTDALDITLKIY